MSDRNMIHRLDRTWEGSSQKIGNYYRMPLFSLSFFCILLRQNAPLEKF